MIIFPLMVIIKTKGGYCPSRPPLGHHLPSSPLHLLLLLLALLALPPVLLPSSISLPVPVVEPLPPARPVAVLPPPPSPPPEVDHDQDGDGDGGGDGDEGDEEATPVHLIAPVFCILCANMLLWRSTVFVNMSYSVLAHISFVFVLKYLILVTSLLLCLTVCAFPQALISGNPSEQL